MRHRLQSILVYETLLILISSSHQHQSHLPTKRRPSSTCLGNNKLTFFVEVVVALETINGTMKFVAVLFSLFASASAFAPTVGTQTTLSTSSSTTTLQAFADELGAQPPLGYFDPLGLVADGNQENFDRLRYVEIKHGRISMLAVVGYLATEGGLRWPGDIDLSGTTFESIPSGFNALVAMPQGGVAQIFAFIGFLGKRSSFCLATPDTTFSSFLLECT